MKKIISIAVLLMLSMVVASPAFAIPKKAIKIPRHGFTVEQQHSDMLSMNSMKVWDRTILS